MKLFRDIIGHQENIHLLQNAISQNQVAHAYLFLGPKGVGKKTTALAFARTLFCSCLTEGDACGHCRCCQQANEGNHPDLHQISPTGSSIKIDQVREIQKIAALKPYQGQRVIFLLEQVETMTPEAANCLLKLLEEPNQEISFILLSTQPHALLSTVVSRCQILSFRALSTAEITRGLKQTLNPGEKEIHLALTLAGGSLGQALKITQDKQLQNIRDETLIIVRNLKKLTLNEICRKAEELAASRDMLAVRLDIILLWYRDILLWQLTRNQELLLNQDYLTLIPEEALFYTPDRLFRIMSKIEQTQRYLNTNVNGRLAIEVLMLNLR
ncbi:MAG TPA: DNA polymerase III subunit delta' [Desulfotomaculum sp.]|nr:DNA polymerase III subunit delta' [Desulfotomaculum sp.]